MACEAEASPSNLSENSPLELRIPLSATTDTGRCSPDPSRVA